MLFRSSTVNSIPSINGTSSIISDIKSNLYKLRDTNIKTLHVDTSAIQTQLNSFEPQLLALNATMLQFKTSLDSLPNTTALIPVVDALEAPISSPLNDTFLTRLSNNLNKFASGNAAPDNAATVAAQLREFKSGLQQIQSANVGSLVTALKTLNNSINNIPNVAVLATQVTALNTSLYSVNILVLNTDISAMNDTMTAIIVLINSVCFLKIEFLHFSLRSLKLQLPGSSHQLQASQALAH